MPRLVFMRTAEVCEVLGNTPFAELSEPDLSRVAQAAKPLSFAGGERLWSRGDMGTFACVAAGAFDVVHFGATVDTLGHGRVLGLSALSGRPHSADVHARITEKGRSPMALTWSMEQPGLAELFALPHLLRSFLHDATRLVHHLNELQVLHRRKSGAVAHVAAHLRRLLQCAPAGNEVEIGQKDLGALAGYDERTVRVALAELQRQGCVEIVRRSVYRLDERALAELIDRAKLCESEP